MVWSGSFFLEQAPDPLLFPPQFFWAGDAPVGVSSRDLVSCSPKIICSGAVRTLLNRNSFVAGQNFYISIRNCKKCIYASSTLTILLDRK